MTSTEVANVSDLLDLSIWFGAYAGHFDVEAVTVEYVAALNELAGEGIAVTRSGVVFADLDMVDRARGIDWQALADLVDLESIASRHSAAAECDLVAELELGAGDALAADRAYGIALWYAWGRIDSGQYGAALTTQDGFDFADGRRTAETQYARHETAMLPSVPGAWDTFVATRARRTP